MFRSRYRQILRFFGSVVIGVVWWDVLLSKIGFRGLARRTRPRRMRRAATRFRTLAVRMGGVLIKVGQFLSARLDVLPREITGELSGLQDEVGAEEFEDIKAEIEAAFGVPVHEKFRELNPIPIASASIGQVHQARLPVSSPENGLYPAVVVKVQRPHIREIVEQDLAAIRVVGGWLTRFAFVRRHTNVPGLIEEFSRSLYEEMDYILEGKNADRFSANFKTRPDVLVPGVVWSHTSKKVLTLEDVGAIKITDYAGIEAAEIDRGEVANRLLDTYLKQVFEDGFFHADPHPGNLFVLPSPARAHPRTWRLVFVDFGMTGTLAPATFTGLRDALIAVGTRDAGRLVEAYQKLDLLLPGADLELLERATRAALDKIWGKTTREMMNLSVEEASEFANEFRDLLYEMPFQVPENFILLGRCVSILSGMATGLDPDFNVWNGIAPYAKKLVEAEVGNSFRIIFGEISSFVRMLAALPKRLDSFMTRVEQGKLDVRIPEMKQHVARLERSFRKVITAIIFAAFLMCATAFSIAGRTEPAVAFSAISGFLLLLILFGR
jgi:predicted unusual protein kinase regulating ubiquinone biosynthesis (AarF/ABC1/UbiB family)